MQTRRKTNLQKHAMEELNERDVGNEKIMRPRPHTLRQEERPKKTSEEVSLRSKSQKEMVSDIPLPIRYASQTFHSFSSFYPNGTEPSQYKGDICTIERTKQEN